MHQITTDYLVVGSGATGLAFADTLLAESDARILIVDRHGKPGGHWNDAYPFVSLHQPSAFYGVNSLPLGSGRKDAHGLNAGLYELAPGAEVSGYFDAVMHRQLLASGRVEYRPMCDYRGEGHIVSLLSGETAKVHVLRRIVDCTFAGTAVPSTHTPKFEIEAGARVVTPTQLTLLGLRGQSVANRFVILGAGKTAMDVAIWLLAAGASAKQITWVRPRDSWVLNRRGTQPGLEFFEETIGGQAAQMEAYAQATSIDDLFARLEAAGIMLRIDPSIRPTMFHYAILSTAEIEMLRRIRDVVRMGRVKAVTPYGLTFDSGTVSIPDDDVVYIDCSASAVERRPSVPIFEPGKITPQLVRSPQPTFSAALIAFIEARYDDDHIKNALCEPAPIPDQPEDLPSTVLANLRNQGAWMGDSGLQAWLGRSRLDGFSTIIGAVEPEDQARIAILNRIRSNVLPAFANLQKLLEARTAT